MSVNSQKFNVIRDGVATEVTVDLENYRTASDAGMGLTQYINSNFGGDQVHGTAMQQMIRASGLSLGRDHEMGIRPPTVHQVLTGDIAGVRPDGSDRSLGARILFPELLLNAAMSTLSEDNNDFLNAYDRMHAITHYVDGPRVDQALIDVDGTQTAENAAQPISQSAEPAAMLHIRTSDRNYKIPTSAIGLEITDEAQKAASIDLVALAVMNQARFQRILGAEASLKAIISGDADLGEASIAGVNLSTFDMAKTAGKVSHKSYLKWMRNDFRRRTINWILADIDSALLLEDRTGRPNVNNKEDASSNFSLGMTVDNLILTPPRLLIVDSDVISANVIVGLDSRFALQKFVNVSASYEAIEAFVMRRTTKMRFDFAERSAKLYTQAWSKAVID